MTTTVQPTRSPHVLITAPRDERDWAQYSSVAAQAFGGNYRDLSVHGTRGIARVAVVDDQVVGGAIALDAAQFFGGRAVPTGCVCDVCVRPEWRAHGIAQSLVGSLTEHLRMHGGALGCLWAPSPGVYRRWGWEIAGLSDRWSVPASALRAVPSGEDVVVAGFPVGARELQHRLAAGWNGPLDRPDWWWDWKHAPTAEKSCFAVQDADGRLSGLLSYTQQSARPWGHDLMVHDFWTLNRGATRSLLRFLGEHAGMVQQIHFDRSVLPGLPSALFELFQYEMRQAGQYPWMLKLIDVPRALQARGWPTGLEGRVDFLVDDSARLVLEVAHGTATVRVGGSGTVRMTSGQLAAWYAGALSFPVLSAFTGGDSPALALLAGLTAGRDTWLPDVF